MFETLIRWRPPTWLRVDCTLRRQTIYKYKFLRSQTPIAGNSIGQLQSIFDIRFNEMYA